ncbi:MAG: SRPBCC family protein [Sciscionella sp.]
MAEHTDNAVLVDAPLELAWEMTNDVPSWPSLFSEYAAAEVLERHGDTVRFRLTMHPDANGNAWSWVSERTVSAATHTVRARRTEPGWFRYMDILWSYRQTPDGVEMRWIQDFEMRPDSPVDDAAMAERLNRNTAIQQQRIKGLIETAHQDAVPAPATA